MNARYAPYADWGKVLDLSQLPLSAHRPNVWWRNPSEIRQSRGDGDLPLAGLRVALDPGHIGAEWAQAEARHFKIAEADFAIREGELVLLVAQHLRESLVQLGAEVILLREKNEPVNLKKSADYLEAVTAQITMPDDVSIVSLVDYAIEIQKELIWQTFVIGELVERARLVNEEIQPDVLLSLHINASHWPLDENGELVYELVDLNHTHVLIFGCMSDHELASPRQQERLLTKLTNGSAAIEVELGDALGKALGKSTALPPSVYQGKNAVLLEGRSPYLWARNLLLLRKVDCPTLLLEPYIANSKGAYIRLQKAIATRVSGDALADDDILVEYSDAVVAGLLKVYGTKQN